MTKFNYFKSVRLALAAVILGACGLGLTSPANADPYSFSVSSSDLTADGVFFTGAPDAGGFDIISITGISNGSAITGLLTPGTCCFNPSNNNIFFTSGNPYLDGGGLAYATAAGDWVNIYSVFASVVPNGFDIVTTAGNGFPTTYTSGNGTVLIEAIPEPETYALMLAGLGLMGFVSRRRKQRTA